MFVTGCHRSGTSLLASLVRGLLDRDAPAGEELPPALDNPRGFQESKPLNQLNNRLLELAGCRWDRPPLLPPDWSSAPFFQELFDARDRFASLALKRDWVEKNPRLCITAGAMEHLLLRRVPMLAVLREPQAVAVSLFRRNGMPLEQGLMLWFLYNHHLAASLQPDDLVLSFRDLKAAGDVLQGCLAAFLKQHGLSVVPLDSDVLADRIDPELDRAGGVPLRLEGREQALAANCLERYEACLASGVGIDRFKQVFADLPAALLPVLGQRGQWQWHSGG
ncbi:hypothetical protein [Synechococcus sp. MIT S1220]|uniref:hypothetical protein n=1 Tax=Synechococcus sp. MIT S1220 TaxID=3082549 RepID=UPI0039AF1B51